MDGIQSLLIIVVVVLTLLLILVGVQVFLILLDLRRGVRKINTILDDSIFGGGMIRPEKLSGILELFRKGNKSGMKN